MDNTDPNKGKREIEERRGTVGETQTNYRFGGNLKEREDFLNFEAMPN
jgi:hypothetical protein